MNDMFNLLLEFSEQKLLGEIPPDEFCDIDGAYDSFILKSREIVSRHKEEIMDNKESPNVMSKDEHKGISETLRFFLGWF